MYESFGLLIDNSWRPAADGATRAVTSPVSGEPVGTIPKATAEDMELAGVHMSKGSFVHLSLSAAGHDPEVYDDPERFDVTRSPNRHLSFGHGAHFCIGAPLARLQGEIAFSALLRRLPGLELAVPPEEITWLADSSLSRGLESLRIRVGKKLPA